MDNRYYLSGAHYITKAMTDVNYPITKQELIEQVGNREVRVEWDEYKPLKELLGLIKIDNFENAASFFSALYATHE